jgi:hypothetical protein
MQSRLLFEVRINFSEYLSALEKCNHSSKCFFLTLYVFGPANGRADIQASNDLPWWARERTERSHDRNEYGRNPSGLEASCDQTHGLMANRSRRNQQGTFDRV